jgi:hypothetical protein
MRKTNRLLSVVGILLAFVASASAQVMKQVPASAFAVLKVSDLETTNKKVSDLAAAVGISQMQPDLADPLGAMLRGMGVTDGVNRAGELAMAYLDPDATAVPSEKSVLVLIPVSDYQKFIGNFPDAAPMGDVTQVHFKNDKNNPAFIAHWGDYAAVSPAKEIVAKPPTDIIAVDGLAAKELDSKDAVILGNLKGLRPKLLQLIDKGRQEAPSHIDQMIAEAGRNQGKDYTKFSPLAKQIANQALDIAQQFAESANAGTFSINLSPDGIATTLACQFEPDSSWGQHVAAVKNTDESLLGGLGAGKYLVFGGAGPQEIGAFLAKVLPPIEKSITDLGPDYAPINDWLNAMQKAASSATGSTYGMLAPTAAPGAGALVQLISIRHGDAKGVQEAMREMQDAQAAALKSLGLTQFAATQTFTKDSKIVDGISFDEIKGQIPANGRSPQEAQAMQFISMIYGPQGPDVFTGVVNDQTLLTVMGLDDAGISSAIANAKSGDDPLAKNNGVKAVAAQLPAQRFAVSYVPLDLWATTGLAYAKMFGIDMGVTLPDNLPPIGTTLSTDGPAVRADTYIPMQLLQALTSAGMQVYMKTQNVGQPPQGGGPTPGGM